MRNLITALVFVGAICLAGIAAAGQLARLTLPIVELIGR